jgi:hypothetical protein
MPSSRAVHDERASAEVHHDDVAVGRDGEPHRKAELSRPLALAADDPHEPAVRVEDGDAVVLRIEDVQVVGVVEGGGADARELLFLPRFVLAHLEHLLEAAVQRDIAIGKLHDLLCEHGLGDGGGECHRDDDGRGTHVWCEPEWITPRETRGSR